MAGSALVTEEVGHWAEAALVGALSLSLLELLVHQEGDELLSLDLGQLDGAGELMLDQKLLLHEVWKRVEEGVGPWGQKVSDIGVLIEQLLL